MEPVFRTEQEMEGYLVNETRLLALPDGTTRPFTGSRLLWLVFEDVLRLGYTHEQLVAYAFEETKLSGQPFEVTFPGVLAYIDKHLIQRR